MKARRIRNIKYCDLRSRDEMLWFTIYIIKYIWKFVLIDPFTINYLKFRLF